MSTMELTADNLNQVTFDNDFVISDFCAEWYGPCGPCRTFGPRLRACLGHARGRQHRSRQELVGIRGAPHLSGGSRSLTVTGAALVNGVFEWLSGGRQPLADVLVKALHLHAEDLLLVDADKGGVPEHLQ